MSKKILVAGGAGYIGSHTCVELSSAGFDYLIVDDFSNSKPQVVDRLQQITGSKPRLVTADITDRDVMREVFVDYRPDAVINFAGFKAVGESVRKPLAYYRNNLDSALTLLELCQEFGTKSFVFSSSATVYGVPESVPISENAPLFCTNPYGWTKLMIEQIMQDVAVAHPEMSVIMLRYFNPVGAHASGMIGEDPQGIPNNLMPYISQVAIGKLEKLSIFGNDYDTPDGTGVRDYIHVVDLAKGHVAALNYSFEQGAGVTAVNLGAGKGYSVLDLVNTFAEINQVVIPYEFAPRRAGDIAASYADASKAKRLFNWQTEKSLEDMCRDTWRWQQQNPRGYDE